MAGEEAAWWWNPLTYVTDGERAAEMAANFSLGSRAASAKSGDAYFDSAGRDLLAGLLLAAAAGGEPIERVHYWLTRPTEDQAVQYQREAGWRKEADAVAGAINAPDKQREGILATLALGALFTAQERAREINTQTTIYKLHAAIMDRWEGYRYRRLPITKLANERISSPAVGSGGFVWHVE